jgi:hypothetical protein
MDHPPRFNRSPLLLHDLPIPNNRSITVADNPRVIGQIEPAPIPFIPKELGIENDRARIGQIISRQHISHPSKISPRGSTDLITVQESHIPSVPGPPITSIMRPS